nr:serine protease 55 isoform X1 [Dasypus novemcinctus]
MTPYVDRSASCSFWAVRSTGVVVISGSGYYVLLYLSQILTFSGSQPRGTRPVIPRAIWDSVFFRTANTVHSVTSHSLPPLPLCFRASRPRELNIVLGTNDLNGGRMDVKTASSIVLHRGFEKTTMDNDIALLLMTSPITFGDMQGPICLPKQSSPDTWHECWVAGWGWTKAGDKTSGNPDLLKVPMAIMDWEACSRKFPRLTKNMLCAGYKDENYDACQGDSGGPLVCTPGPEARWYQVGIISWGKSCGERNTPGIYTQLANYHLWIANVTRLEGRPFSTKEPAPKEASAPPKGAARPLASASRAPGPAPRPLRALLLCGPLWGALY